MSIVIKGEIDFTEAQEKAEKFTNTTKRSLQSMVMGLRRTAQMGIMLSQAVGETVEQTAQLGVEALMLSIELVTTTASAYAAGGPLLTFKSAMMLASIISMLAMIRQLKKFQYESARRTQGLVSTFRLLSF